MHRILFVCLGNICRSPMAEMILKDMVKKRGLEKEFEIASCATSTEEIGIPCIRRRVRNWREEACLVHTAARGS